MNTGNFSNIPVEEVYKLAQNNTQVHLLDVREPDEYTEYNTPLSRLVPLSRLMEGRATDDLLMPKNEPIYVICRSGRRSMTACELLHQQGFTTLYNVVGGMEAWVRAGLPFTRS